jgi:hypothetical protein
MSYAVGGRSLVLAAIPAGEGATVAFELATAEGGSAWQPFARLEVGEPLAAAEGEALEFEVTHDAGGFAVGGRWREARAGAYTAARSVEDTPAGSQAAHRKG